MSEFERELTALLNRFSQENDSNTPDFILAAFIADSLLAWTTACRAREDWYGVHHAPGKVGGTTGPARVVR